MRKTKFITLTLFISLMLMGAGYAAWNETVIISNAATTGELKVEFVEACALPLAHATDNNRNFADEVTAVAIHGNKTTRINVSNFYPGAIFLHTTKIKNLGTIPAKIQEVVVDLKDTPLKFQQEVLVCGDIIKFDPINGPSYMGNLHDVPLNQLEANLNTALKDKELKSGEYFTFETTDDINSDSLQNHLSFRLPIDSVSGNELENDQFSFDIKIIAKQFNK